MHLTGIHHLTAVTSDVGGNHAFYTGTLGLRLVKKTVNQDDVSAYHLFYADGLASPGTDITFFDWPMPRERRGTQSIVRTGFRVGGEASLRWWMDRFARMQVNHGGLIERDGRPTVDFEDPEGQRLSLVVDDFRGSAHPWAMSPVPEEHQIRGLGPITLSVPRVEPTEQVLTQVLQLRAVREYRANSDSGADGAGTEVRVYEMGEGGPGGEIHVLIEPGAPRARLGAGGVHHVALRTPSEASYEAWDRRLRDFAMPTSGPVNRYYFRSLYFREPNGILFEIATDGPGFATDEPLAQLGESLALPPFLESRRREIEAGLKPIRLSDAE